jgi:hypothetical protein
VKVEYLAPGPEQLAGDAATINLYLRTNDQIGETIDDFWLGYADQASLIAAVRRGRVNACWET